MSMRLLSIIIATKDRAKYCQKVIETILSYDTDSFELVIHDNSRSTELKQYIETNIDDQRVVYNYDGREISSIDNFNASMDLATGEYICMIGDDDGILPQIFTATEWARENGVDSLCQKSIIAYQWPIVSEHNGLLYIPKYGNGFKFSDQYVRLEKLLNRGTINYAQYHLPRVYHGVVLRERMEEVRQITGHYFGGLSPDIYSTVALSFLVNKHAIIDYPITIAGACEESSSIASLKKKHSGKLEEAPHLRNRGGYNWSHEIPRYYSTETIWADSAMHAMEEMGKPISLRLSSLAQLFAYSLLTNRAIKALIVSELRRFLFRRGVYSMLILPIIIGKMGGIIVRSVYNRTIALFYRKNKVERDVSNIEDAIAKCVQVSNTSHPR